MTRLILFILAISFCLSSTAAGPSRLSIGFYNVENLFDTVPSLDYDDSQFTPGGRNSWGRERYSHKVKNICRVIDAMNLDVIALAEVESETVVRDIVMSLKTDYNYIWRNSGDRRGMDMAVLYKGDKFIVEDVRQVRTYATRQPLYVRGMLDGCRVDIVVCHMPSMLNGNNYRQRAMRSLYDFAHALHRDDPDARLILIGDFNAAPTDRIMKRVFHIGRYVMHGPGFLFNPLVKNARQGMGTYVYDGRWLMYDNVLLDIAFISGSGLRYSDCGVFVRDFMLDHQGVSRKGYPLRSFSSGKYLAGYSDHLPIFVVLEKVE